MRRRHFVASVAISIAVVLPLSGCDEAAKESAERYIAQAREYRDAGDPRSGIIQLKNAIRDYPENAEARALLGRIYLEIGNSPSASKELQRARDLGHDDTDVRLILVQSWLLQREYNRILDEVSDDMTLDGPEAVELFVVRGEALFARGRVDEATAIFDKALSTEPVAAAYAGLARVALSEGAFDTAERHLGDGLERHPQNVGLLAMNGARLLRVRDFEGAEASFSAALALKPSHVGSRLGSARAKIGLRKHDEAKVLLEALDAEAPDNLTVRLLRGVIALETQDYELAQDSADKVLSFDASNLVAMYVAGASSYALDRFEKAHSLLSQYVALVPSNEVARRLLAATQLRLGQGSAAYDTLQSVEIKRTNLAYPVYTHTH